MTETLVTGITSIFTSIATANTFLWGLFEDLLSMIMGNALIAIPVLFAVLAGSLTIVMRVIRRFGVKGKR